MRDASGARQEDRRWQGVGVFFIRDRKIVDWYDYTIAVDQV